MDASLVYDAGRIYLVWLVGRGKMECCAAVEPQLLEKRDPLLRPYTEDHIKRLRKQIQGMERSQKADKALLSALKIELNEYLSVHTEVLKWQA